MEFMGFQEALTFLLGTAVIIKAFISDRHSQIAKWMRVECPKKCKDLGKPVIDHFFDLWHIGKSKLLNTNILHYYIRHITIWTTEFFLAQYHSLPFLSIFTVFIYLFIYLLQFNGPYKN